MMRSKVKHFLTLGLVASLVACGERSAEFDGTVGIKGQLKNQPEGHVILSRFEDDRAEVVDTIPVNDKGQFDYELSLDGPSFYELNLYEQKFVRLALFDEDVKVEYDFEKEEDLKISGSHDTDQVLKVDALVEKYQEEINQLNSVYYDAMS